MSRKPPSCSSQLHRLFGEACTQHRLTENGDRILIGLSGGKDSLALVQLLAWRQSISVPSINAQALHVRMKGIDYESDTDYLQSFCQACNIPLTIIETALPQIPRRPPCFCCSWQRRKVLFEEAERLGCNKLALGHHQDDLLRTALMNLTFQGRFETMPPVLALRKMPLSIIRPLCYIPEELLTQHALEQDYKPLRKHCPYEQQTQRTDIEQVLETMQRLSPDARHSLWHAIIKTF